MASETIAGDTLVFQLHIITTGGSWYSDPSLNGGDGNHAYATSFSGDGIIPAGIYVGFEDASLIGGDIDYNDHQFVFSGVSSIPEPHTWVSFLSGIGMLLVCCNAKRGGRNRRRI